MDRIDLYSSVHEVKHRRLLGSSQDTKTSERVRARIQIARAAQAERFGGGGRLNADMTNSDIKQLAKLQAASKDILDEAATKLNLSARAYMRTVKVARTIADLAGDVEIGPAQLSEALAYRHHSTAT